MAEPNAARDRVRRSFIAALRSDAACAQCLRPERPWRRMMWFPLSVGGAFICSDRCWDRFVERDQ